VAASLDGMTSDGQYILFSSAATHLGLTLPQVMGLWPYISYIVKNPLF